MAKLKIDIRESIELNSNKYDNFNSYVVEAVNEIDKRITTIPLTEQDLVRISGSIGRGAYINSDVRYMRFTNIGSSGDTAANIILTFKNTNDNEFAVKIPTGGSFMYQGISGSGVTYTTAASSSALSGSSQELYSLSTITAISTGSTTASLCDLEYFIASN